MHLRTGLAIDIGTVNTLFCLNGRGIAIEEPSAIARDRANGEIVAVGSAAHNLAGKGPEGIDVVYPLRDGVIVDLTASTRMLQAFMARLHLHSGLLRPQVVVGVPRGATWLERRAVGAAIAACRPHCAIKLIDEPVAAAIGSGVDPSSTQGVLVVDIGGGTTEIAVVANGRVARAHSLRVGGNAMDDAVMRAVKTEIGVLIGPRTAERLKITMGLTGGEAGWSEAVGVVARGGNFRKERVSGQLVAAALDHVVNTIIGSVEQLLSGAPPDLVDEVIHSQIRIAGGGALLLGLAERMERSIGVPATVVDDPLRCVVRGAAEALNEMDGSKDLLAAA